MKARKPIFALQKEESFFLNNFNIDFVFNTIERTDYLYLYYIKACSKDKAKDGKVYLSTVGEAMHLSIPELSKAIEKLQDKGYVIWKTDNTAGKTYVELSGKAIELMEVERIRMQKSYRKIMEEIGETEILQMSATMKKIREILKRNGDMNPDSK